MEILKSKLLKKVSNIIGCNILIYPSGLQKMVYCNTIGYLMFKLYNDSIVDKHWKIILKIASSGSTVLSLIFEASISLREKS